MQYYHLHVVFAFVFQPPYYTTAKVWGVAGHSGLQESADASADAGPAELAKYGRKYLAGRLAVRTWW